MRRLLAVASLAFLAACESDPGSMSNQPVISAVPQFIAGFPGDGPQFGVSALQQAPSEPGYAGFNKAGADVAAAHAAQICTRGYQKLEETTAPGAPVSYTLWRGRCDPYRLSF